MFAINIYHSDFAGPHQLRSLRSVGSGHLWSYTIPVNCKLLGRPLRVLSPPPLIWQGSRTLSHRHGNPDAVMSDLSPSIYTSRRASGSLNQHQ
jgi:hypothetical protein